MLLGALALSSNFCICHLCFVLARPRVCLVLGKAELFFVECVAQLFLVQVGVVFLVFCWRV